MKKQFYIGNITKVKWHYRNVKYGYNAWGHSRETFDEKCYTIINNKEENYNIRIIDSSMNSEKNYAYIEINNNLNLHIRNLFDSKHEKGFSQKNTFFRDNIYYDLFLDDTSNLVDAYLQLGNTTKDNNWILYLCVEYEPTINIDLDLLLYCSELERNKTELEDKLRIIDMQNDFITNKTKKSRFTFFW
jgi:hypothetical protein